mmetsp:Transcript_79760/g.125880  ORF Transcript_79760/g.125880 Transcript_79760/m.125880 type:complete len:111 (-) Transcript_79760:158-490(-)
MILRGRLFSLSLFGVAVMSMCEGSVEAKIQNARQSPPLKDLETETTASSGDDNAKKLLEEAPFDPNVPQQDSLSSGLRSHTSGQVAKVKQDSPRPPPEDRGQVAIQAPPL